VGRYGVRGFGLRVATGRLLGMRRSRGANAPRISEAQDIALADPLHYSLRSVGVYLLK